MTTETRIIVRPAPDALRAVGPIKTHADAPTPSDSGGEASGACFQEELGRSGGGGGRVGFQEARE
ncbi:hypothetical protein PF010_g27944 [Phytophthora fragariae]|uniref:Uncharacterized protein n=1 Tax=Phytophthora fragariae TaxID=53985 RepID=A0A6A3PUR5_9STRA|nr:hypothetical protein PF003_g22786 [Phytophthora fragariae]KAE8921791.1 hypothetical protein PF009_g27936 [Phytophthora fragariae]KAE9059621.1 hypothetical protein PF006_g31838 [Phytophthora fragariae]KAE9066090.1 hypothetical protein PF010_g27944 [Phytophthora fragariae]KAE9272260.1 hypothetical protein PF001_g28018 [Phytophthora fragariae]